VKVFSLDRCCGIDRRRFPALVEIPKGSVAYSEKYC
jgi:hypothetical protein